MTHLTDFRWTPDPFPHAICDDLWDRELLLAARDEFPDPDDPRWITYNDPKEYGKAAGPETMWGPAVREWFRSATTPEFCAYLSFFTKIRDLSADALGGGMHQTREGGVLDSHIDFGIHPVTGLERRVNLLCFLNEGWTWADGGAVRLGDPSEPGLIEALPSFNRTVIFETSNTSWHGHPEPVAPGKLRRSLAVYYYAPVRAETAERAGTTIWLADVKAPR